MGTDRSPRGWSIAPLAAHHDRAAFSCGNGSLDRYLKQQARQDARRRAAAPFVLVEEADSDAILGYYTLSAFGVGLGDLPADIAKKLPHYPLIPATLLGRLAVDLRSRGRGFGELLAMDALHRALTQSNAIASALVVVDAVDEQAWRFYRHLNFIAFPESDNRLFLPMKTIAKLFPNG
jgi:GNAT superfamily N-acetyltransferase